MVGRHGEMGQKTLIGLGRGREAFDGRDLLHDPVRAEFAQDFELTTPGGGGASVREIDNRALPDTVDGGVRGLDEASQILG